MATVILYAHFLHKPSAVSLRNYLTVNPDLYLSSVRRQGTVLVRTTLNQESLCGKKKQQDSLLLVKASFPIVLQLIYMQTE